jgi:hypothetical protein
MTHVLQDPRVKTIIGRMVSGTLTMIEAREAILDLTPAKKGTRIGGPNSAPLESDEKLPPGWLRPGRLFLEWEADMAIESVTK